MRTVMQDVARGLGAGLAGVALGCGIVAYAVAQSRSLDSMWINVGCLIPAFAVAAAQWMVDSPDSTHHARVRRWLTLVAMLVCVAGNYTSFVITSRTWFADKIAPEHRGFFHQLAHPWVLPSFFEERERGEPQEQTWGMYLFVGALVGPFMFRVCTRRASA